MAPINRLPGAVILVAAIVLVGLVGFITYSYLSGNVQPGSAVFSVTTFYDDDSSKTDSGNGSPLLGEKIVDDTTGKVVENYEIMMKINPVYSGTATSTRVSGTVTYTVSGVIKKVTNISYDSKIPSKESTLVFTDVILAETLEAWDEMTGENSVEVSSEVLFEVTYSSGVVSMSANPAMTISYTLQQEITSLTITFSAPAVFS